ncbi:hypothetical protein F0L68_33735 [Solihabitans fulvus]|uniref:Uncharacterized protein n=1 Tax=Solihabitans fulvus TaxID=1892852 RepID=A0A5B2WQT3_9PSEU|nr:hypothetical protein [Solihabitans fulvus]KAA2253022.1 hypothetical protein F0L68_33735 [Solihabitans fulvus]
MGLLDRLRDRHRDRRGPALTVDSPGLVVVAEAFDPAEADSAALARAHAWARERPAVLRHHLTLPEASVERAATLLAQDGWELRPDPARTDGWHATRVQALDALHCAQERSRMAGLAQRLGGDSAGWDALQPAANQPDRPAG